MEPITQYSMPIQQDCCYRKIRKSLEPLSNIEEGVKIIQKILMKDLLCLHDVVQIDKTYQQISLLERQVEHIPKSNTQHVLNSINVRVISCVKDFGKDRVKDAKNLISLYYLKNFSYGNLSIENDFHSLFRDSKYNPQIMTNIARYLPTCGSEAKLDEDIKFLMNSYSSNLVTKILTQKKETIQIIKAKKLELENWRKNNPIGFPDYFDELLEGAYFHLYDHIIEMRKLSTRNDRQAAIEKLSFSLLSHVVIETREAIIRKIESSIPNNCPQILFLLGGSGAGKSTTFCFLRGDEMVLKGSNYESKRDKNSLIGHELATSCTFLPTVEFINDWLIVDFPGFDDSNGPFISLGMECALKALIRKHQPKVLIIESIINTEGRFAAAAHQGSRLKRLLDKKEECVLGITKYSRDSDFGKIKAIEEQQKRERSLPTPEESQLTTEINLLVTLNQESFQPTIRQKQQRLGEIQEEKARQHQVPLPENDEKVESMKNLQERENELLKQIGLAKIIRFDDLQNSACLPSYFADLSQGEALNANPEDPLDPDHEKLIDHLFVNDLLVEMKKVKYGDFKFENFEESVKESSLISTLFSESHPEIGTFLHLAEIDPRIVQNYDKKIVGECLEKYKRSVILNLDISLIKVALKEMKGIADPMSILDLQKKFTKLEKYVMGLLGVELNGNENTEEIEVKWIENRKDIAAAAVSAVEVEYTLPNWVNVLFTIPLGIPIGIHALVKWYAQKQVEKKTIEKIIKDCSEELNQMYDMLMKLQELELLIKKREDLDQAFNSVKISVKSQESLIRTIEERINKVRLIYGENDWDRRIEFLAVNLTNKTEEWTKELNEAETLALAFNILAFSIKGKNLVGRGLVLNASKEFSSFFWLPAFFKSKFSYSEEEVVGLKIKFEILKIKFKVYHGKVNQALMAATLLLKYKIESTGRQKEFYGTNYSI